MSCGVGHRCGSDPALLWLWHRLPAIVPIQPLAWELPRATGTALRSKKSKQNKWDSIKLKSYVTAKETINKVKKTPVEWEKIFANHLSDKGFMSKYIWNSDHSMGAGGI